jgi:hypothetical protein
MVYLLKMVIFHGYVSHNQMVNVAINQPRTEQSRKCGLVLIEISEYPSLQKDGCWDSKPKAPLSHYHLK